MRFFNSFISYKLPIVLRSILAIAASLSAWQVNAYNAPTQSEKLVIQYQKEHVYEQPSPKNASNNPTQHLLFNAAKNITTKTPVSDEPRAFAPLVQPNTSYLPNSLLIEPTLHGTVFLNKNIFTKNDPNSFKKISYSGREVVSVRTFNTTKSIKKNSYVFKVLFDDNLSTTLYIMPEYGTYKNALKMAKTVAYAQGRIPAQLRKDAKKIHVFKGKGRSFATAPEHSIYLYPQNSEIALLEELLAHESAHTSLDPQWRYDSDWQEAVANDSGFISGYAKDNAITEDIAESFLAYLAVKYKSQRITANEETTFRFANAYRFDFFDRRFKDIYPMQDISDEVKARLISPEPSKTLTNNRHTFRWSKPPNTNAYDLIIGTKGFGSNDIRKSEVSYSDKITVSNLPSDGKAVYVRLWTQYRSQLTDWKNTWRYRDYRITGYSPHIDTASLLRPKPGSIIQTQSTVFSWDAPTGSQAFDLTVGTQGAGSDNIRQSKVIKNTSQITVNNIPENNGTLYVRLWTLKNDNWSYSDFTYQLNKTKAELLGLKNNSTIKSGKRTLQWDAPSRVTHYDIVIGTKGPGSDNIRSTAPFLGNTLKTQLPKGKVYVRLWTQKEEWQYNDYVFTVK